MSVPPSKYNFRKEWKEIIDCLYSVPSIGVWVPFNEAWGQFKAPEIAEWTKAYDPSRLVNPASGGNHYLTGDILDTHHYPHPRMTLLDTNRATVLGEYGGIGLVMKEHLWEPDRKSLTIQSKSFSISMPIEYVHVCWKSVWHIFISVLDTVIQSSMIEAIKDNLQIITSFIDHSLIPVPFV